MSIRVLHIVTNMDRGGIETMLMNYYRHIDREKVQFDFLVHRTEKAAFDDEIESMGGIIYRLPKLIPWSKHYLTELDRFFLKHQDYKIVHSHINCLSSVVLRVAQKYKVPIRIAHSHNTRPDVNITYPIKMYYRRLISNFATNFLACSKVAGDFLFKDKHYKILNNSIETNKYLPNENIRKNIRQAFNITADKYLIGHVGRFYRQKNHMFILEIFAKLCKEDDSYVLMLVGDGPLRRQIEKKCEQLNINERVIFTGVRDDVAHILQAMDAFLFPSIHEGLPLTIIEAQAAGLQCYISDCVTSECMITNCIEQISLNKSSEYWAKKIISNKDVVRNNNLKQIQNSGFDVEINAKHLQEFYEQQYNSL